MKKGILVLLWIIVLSCLIGCDNTKKTEGSVTNSTSAVSTSTAADILISEKVWIAQWLSDNNSYNVYFSFAKDGTCLFAIASGYEIWDAGAGSYSLSNDNNIDIEIVLSGNNKFKGTYFINTDECSLTTTSDEGIVGEKGDVFFLKEDEHNDVKKMQEWVETHATKSEGKTDELSDREETFRLIYDNITLLTDSTLGKLLVKFRSHSYALAQSASDDMSYDTLLTYQSDIFAIIDAVKYTLVPEGYGLRASFDELNTKLTTIRNAVGRTVDAVYDKDFYSVREEANLYSNTGYLSIAQSLKNKISKTLEDIKKQQINEAIAVTIDAEQSEEKAYRVARYTTENKDILLERSSTFYTAPELDGKYYEFFIVDNDSVSVLVDVEDNSAIIKTPISGGFRYEFVNDGELPAEENDDVVPNLIGITQESAEALLESMGCQWELSGYMVADDIDAGSVCYQYPAAGKALFDDTIIYITIAQ